MIYKPKRIKELMLKIKQGIATPKEKEEYKELSASSTEGENLSRISGQKGLESGSKNKIGKVLNTNDRITDKVMSRISHRGDKNNDS